MCATPQVLFGKGMRQFGKNFSKIQIPGKKIVSGVELGEEVMIWLQCNYPPPVASQTQSCVYVCVLCVCVLCVCVCVFLRAHTPVDSTDRQPLVFMSTIIQWDVLAAQLFIAAPPS